MGRKLRTLPTPLKMPSMIRDCSTSFTWAAFRAESVIPARASTPMAISSWSQAPIQLKVSQNTMPMMPMKAGMAVCFPVNILSILALLTCSLLSRGFTTVALQTSRMKEKRMSAMAAALSMPLSVSIWQMICSSISFSF